MNTHNQHPVRVLIVDDSAYMRKVISEIVQRSTEFIVVGTAWDGNDALEKMAEMEPDVVVVDLYMPGLDGAGFIREQMRRKPLPIVICSSAGEVEESLITAMEAGALEYVTKPTARANEQVYNIAADLLDKLRIVARIPASKLPWRELPEAGQASRASRAIQRLPKFPVQAGARRPTSVDVVVIGVSTGGPQALRYLLASLPGDLPVPMAITLHMPEGYTGPFAHRLNEISPLQVLEAQEGLAMLPGRVILAQAGQHLVLQGSPGNVTAHLSPTPTHTPHRPSVDVLFKSAAEVYGARTLAVVMTGMGNDGTAGAAWIKAQGGKVLTEAESSCIVYGMPRCVEEAGLSDQVSALEEMPQAIVENIL